MTKGADTCAKEMGFRFLKCKKNSFYLLLAAEIIS